MSATSADKYARASTSVRLYATIVGKGHTNVVLSHSDQRTKVGSFHKHSQWLSYLRERVS